MTNHIEQIRKHINKLHEIKKAPLQYAAMDLLAWMENDLNAVHELLDEVANAQEMHLQQLELVHEHNQAIEEGRLTA
jgi:hypothetical protein